MYSCLFPIEGLYIIEPIRRSIVPDDTQLSNAVTDGSIDLGTMDASDVRGLGLGLGLGFILIHKLH